jgi:hypothetical protein
VLKVYKFQICLFTLPPLGDFQKLKIHQEQDTL